MLHMHVAWILLCETCKFIEKSVTVIEIMKGLFFIGAPVRIYVYEIVFITDIFVSP